MPMEAGPKARPLLLAVDNDPDDALTRTERELCRRYENDYRVLGVPSAPRARARRVAGTLQFGVVRGLGFVRPA
jgi:hypothetical protein